MHNITVTFPLSLSPGRVKSAIEGNISMNSNYVCTVTFIGQVDGENVYRIESDTAEAYYLIGMTAGELIKTINNPKRNHHA